MPRYLEGIGFIDENGRWVEMTADNTHSATVENRVSTVPLRDENYHFQVGNVSSSYEDGLVVVNKNYVDGQINILSSSIDNKIDTLSSSMDNKINTLSGITVKTSNINQTISGTKTFSNLKCSRAPSSSFDVIRKGDLDGLCYVDNDSSQDFSFKCGMNSIFLGNGGVITPFSSDTANINNWPSYLSPDVVVEFSTYISGVGGAIRFRYYYVNSQGEQLGTSGEAMAFGLEESSASSSQNSYYKITCINKKFFCKIKQNTFSFTRPTDVEIKFSNMGLLTDLDWTISTSQNPDYTYNHSIRFEALRLSPGSSGSFYYLPIGLETTFSSIASLPSELTFDQNPALFTYVSGIKPQDKIFPMF